MSQEELPVGVTGLTSSHDNPLERAKSAPGTSYKLSSERSSEPSGEPLYDPVANAKLAALVSPCFFHRRFDAAVDIPRVLEEITNDEYMSHSRLLQTATGVREVSKQLQRRPVKRAVRNVMIVTKARDNSLVEFTREVAEWLLQTPRYGSPLGVNVYVDAKLRKSKRFGAEDLVAQQPKYQNMLRYWTPDLCWTYPEKFDLVLTLGGDGTVLFTSWLFQRIVPPILSFSLGSLGFLTPFDFENYRNHLDNVMGGLVSPKPSNPSITVSPATFKSPSRESSMHESVSGSSTSAFSSSSRTSSNPSVLSSATDLVHDAGMRVSLRMRFTCTVLRAQQNARRTSSASNAPSELEAEETSQFEVLNELVIDRGPSPYVSNLELFGDDKLLTVIQADGVIFSTPTGSTAYSLSAGGSLVDPSIPAILLTPICPHTLSFRPMLLNDTMALKIAVPRSSRATAFCSFDGKGKVELLPGDFVRVRASRYPFPTVVGPQEGWIDSVSKTLRWNTGRARQKGWKTGNKMPAAGRLSRVGSIDIGHPALTEETQQDLLEKELDEEAAEDEEDEEFDIDFDDAVSEDPYGQDATASTAHDSGYGGGNESVPQSNNGSVPGTMKSTSVPASPVRQMSINENESR